MYHVEWRDVAVSDLTDGWLNADSALRAEITAAVQEIDRRLLRDPDQAGESRKPGTRVLILNPLTVTLHVNSRTQSVLISSVRVHRKQKRNGDGS